jgi:hypothetical protein
MGKLKSFICRKLSFLTSPFQGMKQIYIYLWLFAMIDGRVFQQTVGIHMGTNCPPLLADLFLYS